MTERRTHHLVVTKGEDWHEDQPDWRGEIVCDTPEECGGWWQCDDPHEVDGVSADAGPYDESEGLPWDEKDEFVFHGVEHTWHYGVGWTVPYEGCVVQTVDDVAEELSLHLGQKYGAGTYEVDDDWGDPGECYLNYVEPKVAVDG